MPFGSSDYLTHVDGRPREDGVRQFLASRGLDPPEVRGAIQRRQRPSPPSPATRTAVRAAMRAGVEPAPGRRGAAAGTAAFGIGPPSSPRAGTAPRCSRRPASPGSWTHVWTGWMRRRSPGRQAGAGSVPRPPTASSAAPRRSVLFEDALAGVEAGRRGGFSRAVGVDRAGQAEAAPSRRGCRDSDLSEVDGGAGLTVRIGPARRRLEFGFRFRGGSSPGWPRGDAVSRDRLPSWRMVSSSPSAQAVGGDVVADLDASRRPRIVRGKRRRCPGRHARPEGDRPPWSRIPAKPRPAPATCRRSRRYARRASCCRRCRRGPSSRRSRK